MRHDVDAVWNPWQKQLFDERAEIEQKALDLYDAKNPEKTREYLNDYTNKWGIRVVDKAWKLGDFLWTKYDEKF
jgi:hypothetical protein